MKHFWLGLLAAVLLLPLGACAQEAQDVTADCTFTAAYRSKLFRLTDGKRNVPFETPAGYEAWIEGELPAADTAQGMYLTWTSSPTPATVLVWDGSGFVPCGVCGDRGLSHEYIPLPPATRFRIDPGAGNPLNLCEVQLVGAGELPDWVQDWRPGPEKAELLLVSAHPDDEYIFFGGMIPYYAVERELEVSVCYMTYASERRLHELLDGLWTAGLRAYPTLLPFPDKFSRTLDKGYALWGRDAVLDALAAVIERQRPEVVVTHDQQGEYGHGAHRVAGDACLALIRDEARPLSWRPRKLYLHLWAEQPVVLDWETPTASLGGRTPLEVAQEAFRCHRSQQGFGVTLKNGREYIFRVESGGLYDCARFGLAYTAVGPDVACNDLMENLNDPAKE